VQESPQQPQPRPTGADPKPREAIRAAVQRQLEEMPEKKYAPPPIPDHVLLQRIGSGAYGDVWLARNALGALRAVKLVYRARFEGDRPYEREFNGILKYEPISRAHDGLAQILHVGRNDRAGCFYYVMELADPRPIQNEKCGIENDPAPAPGTQRAGGSVLNFEFSILDYTPRTLRSELAQGQRLPPTEAAQLARRLASALGWLHSQGLVHRDIKPGNVIFVGGQPKLADIGLVTGAGDSRSSVGTDGFIPPEGPGTPQGDIYGLGKLLYELATGCDRLDFPQLPPGLAGLDEGEALLDLNEVITRACAPCPEQRYATAAELEAELGLFLAGRSLREARKMERHRVWLKRFAAVACLLLLLASAAVWLMKNAERRAKEREQQSKEVISNQ
jgi:serine/threonine protein kinase